MFPKGLSTGRLSAAFLIIGLCFVPLVATNALTQIANEDGCRRVNLETWMHPTRKVLEARRHVQLKWLELCQNDTFPVFGVAFDYDPRARTEDFFYPFYIDMLRANGGWAYQLFDVTDKLIIHIAPEGPEGISVSFMEAP